MLRRSVSVLPSLQHVGSAYAISQQQFICLALGTLPSPARCLSTDGATGSIIEAKDKTQTEIFIYEAPFGGLVRKVKASMVYIMCSAQLYPSVPSSPPLPPLCPQPPSFLPTETQLVQLCVLAAGGACHYWSRCTCCPHCQAGLGRHHRRLWCSHHWPSALVHWVRRSCVLPMHHMNAAALPMHHMNAAALPMHHMNAAALPMHHMNAAALPIQHRTQQRKTLLSLSFKSFLFCCGGAEGPTCNALRMTPRLA
jgi:hypothetical protein